MAIIFEDETKTKAPPEKEVGGRTSVAEEPSTPPAEAQDSLPFGKPVRLKKKRAQGPR